MDKRIRTRRKALQLTQAELGLRVGVSKATVSLWENGTNQPNGSNLHRLSAALLCSPDWILTGRDKQGDAPLMLMDANPIFEVPIIRKHDAGKFIRGELVNMKHKLANSEVAASLGASRETFAYIEVSTGMMPRIAPDDMVYIDPKKPLSPDSKSVYLFRVGETYQLGTIGSSPGGLIMGFDSKEAGWNAISVAREHYIGQVVAYIPSWLL